MITNKKHDKANERFTVKNEKQTAFEEYYYCCWKESHFEFLAACYQEKQPKNTIGSF
ncbi:hypothetical protein HanRHA438_Chr07g0318961 [Helianthus annuus]|nr:hypothetical protein HanRHA438_Chr07g0318961 [Helianthus annuus]